MFSMQEMQTLADSVYVYRISHRPVHSLPAPSIPFHPFLTSVSHPPPVRIYLSRLKGLPALHSYIPSIYTVHSIYYLYTTATAAAAVTDVPRRLLYRLHHRHGTVSICNNPNVFRSHPVVTVRRRCVAKTVLSLLAFAAFAVRRKANRSFNPSAQRPVPSPSRPSSETRSSRRAFRVRAHRTCDDKKRKTNQNATTTAERKKAVKNYFSAPLPHPPHDRVYLVRRRSRTTRKNGAAVRFACAHKTRVLYARVFARSSNILRRLIGPR